MAEKQICCCGSSGWTKVIGWLQLVGSIIWIARVVLLLIDVISATVPGTEAVVITGLFFLIVIVSLFMTILLLHGTYNGRPKCLQAWIYYTAIVIVLWVIFSIVRCFSSASAEALGTNIFFIVFWLLVQGFCIWVVNTHRNEILND